MRWLELVITIGAVLYGLWSDHRRKKEREWVHMSLVNLKPSIQGVNKEDVIRSINNMLEFLKPPKK